MSSQELTMQREKRAAYKRRWRAIASNREKHNEANRRWKASSAGRRTVRDWLAIPRNRIMNCLLHARTRARKIGVDFNIEIEDLLPLPDVCPALGLKLNYAGTGTKGWSYSYDSPSLDRINPKLGYVKGNVAIISLRANVLKKDATVEEVRGVLAYMSRFNGDMDAHDL